MVYVYKHMVKCIEYYEANIDYYKRECLGGAEVGVESEYTIVTNSKISELKVTILSYSGIFLTKMI